MNYFGLTEKNLLFLKDIFAKHLGRFPCRIWIFGSRALGSHQPYSDIDLLIDCPQLTKSVFSNICEDFEESAFPFKVDLVDIQKLAPEYAANVHATKKLIWESSQLE